MYRPTTAVFTHTVSWNCFEMRQAWRFIGNSKLKYVSCRLFRIQPVYECLFQKFRSLYRPEEGLLPNKRLILWRGCQKFQSYNAGKSKKFGILVWLLCEPKTGGISNMEIFITEWKMLKYMVMSVAENYLVFIIVYTRIIFIILRSWWKIWNICQE